jgi:hypothetical protein
MYAYSLSQRTAVYTSYQKIIIQPLARYDFFVMGAGLGVANTGADPKSFVLVCGIHFEKHVQSL